MRSEAAGALEILFSAAESENITLYAISGYRSFKRQYDIFTTNVRKQGLEHTKQYSAIPGYSEHQTGLAIDVSAKSNNNRLDVSFAETLEGKWLADNAYLFGYIIRYPEGKSEITGYSYEPWHIRYVGKVLSTYLYENDLTLEEYYNFVPSSDYTNAISYDNLEEFGIDMQDVITRPTKVPPKEVMEEEPIEDPKEEPIEEPNTSEESTQSDETGDSEEDMSTELEDSATPTQAPVPTKALIPTEVPVVTIIPAPTIIPDPTIIPAPTIIPTPTVTPASTET
jgi:D-alanyl-D-alanine carboxypeptidase